VQAKHIIEMLRLAKTFDASRLCVVREKQAAFKQTCTLMAVCKVKRMASWKLQLAFWCIARIKGQYNAPCSALQSNVRRATARQLSSTRFVTIKWLYFCSLHAAAAERLIHTHNAGTVLWLVRGLHRKQHCCRMDRFVCSAPSTGDNGICESKHVLWRNSCSCTS
jgi:hypothetical protein